MAGSIKTAPPAAAPTTPAAPPPTPHPHPRAPSPGYPFDLVPPRAPLTSYAVLVYHLPLSIAFTVRRRAPFVWGGCMLLRARELVGDPKGVLKVGGFSWGWGEKLGTGKMEHGWL